MNGAQILLLLALAGVGLAATRSASAAESSSSGEEDDPWDWLFGDDTAAAIDPGVVDSWASEDYYVTDSGGYVGDLPLDVGAAPVNDPQRNVAAFLALIRRVEPDQADPYRSLVGGGSFTDFANHPAELGWPGIPITSGPNAGKRSYAAGAYQINRTTWRHIDGKRRFGDFSPAAQDAAAVWILQNKRPAAWPLVTAGRFREAIAALRQEWEAFEKMLAGTYHVTLAQAEDYYSANGGAIA